MCTLWNTEYNSFRRYNCKMEESSKFVDLLGERRKDIDILWVSRLMNPLLPHKLSPESKFSRKQIMEHVLTNPKVRHVVESIAATANVEKSELEKKAWDMVNEMASKAHLPTVRWLGFVITKTLKQLFRSFYINEMFLFELKKQMQISQVQYIYVPSHRSYADFVLMSYILFSYDMALPNIASAMDFYHMKVIGELLRKTGAFYMRRSFSTDQLYKEVFRAYVSTIVAHSDRAIEFFIEGTRSRSQKSIVPKYGLLSITLDSLLRGDVPDIHFVPISISYERPVEEMLFAYELLGVPKPKESTTGLFRSFSILRKPQAHGNVFFNIAEPISARKFLDMRTRKAKILSPGTRLPSAIVEDLAYSIIESQQKNTVLTPFNLIALLFNESIQTCPDDPYNFDNLVADYVWVKEFLSERLDATVHPPFRNSEIDDSVKKEIMDTLKIHEELLAFDPSNNLRMKEGHGGTKLGKQTNVKGHCLSEETMRVAAPAINIAIYVNPALSFLLKPALCASAVAASGVREGEAFNRYVTLRTLLRTEFALAAKVDVSLVNEEWSKTVDLLQEQDCLRASNGMLLVGENKKLYCLLRNLILPFVDSACVTCTVLFEWDDLQMGVANEQKVIAESQRRVEQALLEGKDFCQHPYSLTLDLYGTTLSNLLSRGIVVETDNPPRTYIADKVILSRLISELKNIVSQRPRGFYSTAVLYSAETAQCVQAKL